MKTQLSILFLALMVAAGSLSARNTVRVKATNYDISDNLDLEAVASLFGESDDLMIFEQKLNDPKNAISNLDLNNDGYVDYLRVISLSEGGAHLVCIQAVLGEDVYQDVATIEVRKEESRTPSVIVVGNHYLYGPDYIIRPIYYRPPLIFSFLFAPVYRPWYSPYYWGYYPHWYKYRRPYAVHRYRNRVHVHINTYNRYERPVVLRHHYHIDLHKRIGRDDYWKRHPEKSFEKRHPNHKNRHEFEHNRRSERPNVVGQPGNNKSVPAITPNNRNTDRNRYERNDRPAHGNKSVAPDRRDDRQRQVSRPQENKSRNVEPAKKRIESNERERRYVSPRQDEPRRVEQPERRERKVDAPAPRRSSGNEKSSTVSAPKRQQQASEPKSEKTVRKSEQPSRREASRNDNRSTSKTEKKEEGRR